ncbi:hypothetical protein GOP47_0019197 [Adiantum capillus-veneris]|uniref:Uncharacterized protein n=1 Tax=Adiantum capillus-veneris TaxID=13818 RepID=A0A9D4UFK6_ADICA|nr:hypothetical protein GOP47_0019197 [Adiantum capillus-veneris]
MGFLLVGRRLALFTLSQRFLASPLVLPQRWNRPAQSCAHLESRQRGPQGGREEAQAAPSCGFCKEAFEYMKEMENKSLYPNFVTFSCIFKSCGIIWAAIIRGHELHAQIMKRICKEKAFLSPMH